MPDSNGTTGTAILIGWANQQDHWVRALVAEVLQTRKPLSEKHVEHFYDLLLREKELAEGDPVTTPAIPTDTTGIDGEETLILEKLWSVENVNTLATGQEINFNSRMTVLFGENAAGKTGYVRILKCVAAVPTQESILPDINATTPPGSPSASISYRLGESSATISWAGEEGVRPLTRMDAFDAGHAAIYVDDELAYHYTPSELALFRQVHSGVESVQERLESDRQEKKPTRNPFLERFSRESLLYAKIESLGPSTDLTELERLSVVKDEERDQLEALRKNVEALKSGTIKDRLELATSEKDLYERLQKLVKILDDFDVAKYNEALGELQTAQDELSTATEKAFAGTEIPKVLSDAWSAFMEAGEGYIINIEEPEYPLEGNKCIYCRQPLEAAAIDLIGKYRNYCNNTLRQAVTDKQTALGTLTTSLVDHDTEHLKEDVEKKRAAMETDIPDALTKGEEVLASAGQFETAISNAKPIAEGEADDLIAESKTVEKARLELLVTEIEKLTSQVSEREKALKEQSDKLTDLEGRITLEQLFPKIKEHVEGAKWADKAKTIVGRFRGTKRSLTDHAKAASTALLNDNFAVQFEVERKALRAPAVTLEFPGREARSVRKKSLGAEHALSTVLSEGEQKVIALADFVAEASLRSKPTPMIFDDPVNSLDYKRLHYVVDRLVSLSRTRQVAVFTHNIWFTMEILARFEKDKDSCTYYDVSDDGTSRGFVSAGHGPRTDQFSDFKKRIVAKIKEADDCSPGATQDAHIEKGYDLLRAACEAVVEGDLFCGAIRRYQPNVRMTVLEQIKGDHLKEALDEIVPMFEKACRYIASHSQPLETLSTRPDLTELKGDWAKLQAARSAYGKA